MILTAPSAASSTFLAQLANPAARTLILGGAAGVALLAFRVRATSLRLLTWTMVLYAAMAMPLLGWLLPPTAIPAPAFLQHMLADDSAPMPLADAESLHIVQVGEVHGELHFDRPDTESPAAATAPVPARAAEKIVPSAWPPISWTTLAVAVYLLVASLLLTRFVIALFFGRRLLRASRAINDPRVSAQLSAAVNIAESELISVPLTLGAFRSTILLPSGWQEWPATKLDAVLAHELSHVVRRDPLTQRLALLHRAVFWFSPLAWWLERCLADLAEQASDEAALSSGADRKHYARILLDFFEALHSAPGRVWWQGVSMAKSGQAEQRLERILSSKGNAAMQVRKSIAIVVVALAVPLVFIAASAYPQHVPLRPDATISQDQTPAPPAKPSAAIVPDVLPSPAPAAEAAPADDLQLPTPAADPVLTTVPAPVPAIAPRAWAAAAPRAAVAAAPFAVASPIPPIPPVAWQSHGSGNSHSYSRSSYSSHGNSYAYGFDDSERFVIVSGKSDRITMSGDMEDAHHAEKLKKSIQGDFIWFQRDEKSYIIRDQATIDHARALWAPQEELGRKQEELGKQQEELGKQQDELGARMEKVQVKVPDMTADLDKLRAELKALSASGGTVDQLGRIQSEIGELQSKIGENMSNAGDQQGKLGELMGELGEKQGKLGEEQGKLGEQQGELARDATKKMQKLLDEAIANGLAQPEL